MPGLVGMIELRTEDVSSAKRTITTAQFFRFDQPERGTDFYRTRTPGHLFRVLVDDYFLQTWCVSAGADRRPALSAGLPQSQWTRGCNGGERTVPAGSAGCRIRLRL